MQGRHIAARASEYVRLWASVWLAAIERLLAISRMSGRLRIRRAVRTTAGGRTRPRRLSGRCRSIPWCMFLYHEGDRLVSALGAAMSGAARDWTPTEVIALLEATAARTRSWRPRPCAFSDGSARSPASAAARTCCSSARKRSRTASRRATTGRRWMRPESSWRLHRRLSDRRRPAADRARRQRASAESGLPRASQVATVRNMLRAFLFDERPIDVAVSRLNDILENNSLLTGFATLFVGIYDPDDATFNYVSCGQEPGLVYRADSRICGGAGADRAGARRLWRRAV